MKTTIITKSKKKGEKTMKKHKETVTTICIQDEETLTIKEFRSMEDIAKFLGSEELIMTNVGDYIYAVSRKNAKENGEPLYLVYEYECEEDGEIIETNIYGDMVIVGLIPELKALYSLKDDQIERFIAKDNNIA